MINQFMGMMNGIFGGRFDNQRQDNSNPNGIVPSNNGFLSHDDENKNDEEAK